MIIPSFEEERLLISCICKLFYIVFLHIWSAKQSHEVGGTNISMALIFLLRKRASSRESNFHNNQTFIVVVQQRNVGAIILFSQSFYFFLMPELKRLSGAFLPHSLSNSILTWPIVPLFLAFLYIQLDFYVSILTSIQNISWTGVILQLMCNII